MLSKRLLWHRVDYWTNEPTEYLAEVNQISKDVVGKTDPLTGLPAHGFWDPLKGWGGFGMYFLTDRAGPYVKHPDDPAFLFDIDTMKPRINNPGWVQAIQDVMDLIKIEGAYPADQINADPGTTDSNSSLLELGQCSLGGVILDLMLAHLIRR